MEILQLPIMALQERIEQELNENPVLGLEEGAWVIAEDGVVTARGTARVKLFRPAADPVWYQAGDRLPVT